MSRRTLPAPDPLDLACSGFTVEPAVVPSHVLLTFRSQNPRTWMLNKDDARAVALAILAQTGLK